MLIDSIFVLTPQGNPLFTNRQHTKMKNFPIFRLSAAQIKQELADTRIRTRLPLATRLRYASEEQAPKLQRVFRAFLADKNRAEGRERTAIIQTSCDPVAMLIFANMGGKFDSQGVWGARAKDIQQAWFKSGCRDSAKFRAMCQYEIDMGEKASRYDNHYTAHRFVRKAMSFEQTRNLLRGLKFLCRRRYPIHLFNAKSIEKIGRVSLPMRYALINGIQEFSAVWCRPAKFVLNYEFAAQVQHWTKAQKSKLLSPKEAWFFLYGRCPFEKSAPHSTPLASWKKGASCFLQLVAEFAPKREAEMLLPIFNLAALFGSYNEVKKFVGGRWTAIGVHDAGQFTLPADFTPQKWAGFCMRFPEALKYAGIFGKIEQEFDMPKNLNELRALGAQFTYEGAKGFEVLAVLCNQYGVQQIIFDQYKRLYSTVKPAEACPHVDVRRGTYRMYKLDATDFRGALLGLMTDCCQHLTGAGSACAIHGVEKASSAFYVVEKDGKLVAQSWAWRAKSGDLCFDSIEGLHGYDENTIAMLYRDAAEQMQGRLGVGRVLVGQTSYGLTARIKSYFQAQGEMLIAKEKMREHCSYLDGSTQWVLLDGQSSKLRRADAPASETTSFDINALQEGSDVFCEHCGAEVHPSCETCPACGVDISEWV